MAGAEGSCSWGAGSMVSVSVSVFLVLCFGDE